MYKQLHYPKKMPNHTQVKKIMRGPMDFLVHARMLFIPCNSSLRRWFVSWTRFRSEFHAASRARCFPPVVSKMKLAVLRRSQMDFQTGPAMKDLTPFLDGATELHTKHPAICVRCIYCSNSTGAWPPEVQEPGIGLDGASSPQSGIDTPAMVDYWARTWEYMCGHALTIHDAGQEHMTRVPHVAHQPTP